MYDPFSRGIYNVEFSDTRITDTSRDREFAAALWQPLKAERKQLILFSHFSGGSRLSSSFLCEHLASHGYTVAALDHSESALPAPRAAADPGERKSRLEAWIASRVPDIRFLLDNFGSDALHVGVIGHSFGGWTALAAPSVEPRIDAVVALAPAGASDPRPGIIPAPLDFAWSRDVPTLVLAASADVSIPPDRVRDVFDRIPSTKRLVTLRDADHLHFIDGAEREHERVRAMQFPADLAWLQAEMRPFSDLRPEAATHRLIAGLAVAHFDSALRDNDEAGVLLDLQAQRENV